LVSCGVLRIAKALGCANHSLRVGPRRFSRKTEATFAQAACYVCALTHT
jgi:hypothetical protein